MKEAIVVGSGPNGLTAALVLASYGCDVTVLEANSELGGGARSGEYLGDGVIFDHCAAFHPLGASSTAWKDAGLEEQGLSWLYPTIDCAHPLDEGPAALFKRSLAETAEGLEEDGQTWIDLMGPLAKDFPALGEELFRPVLHRPSHPLLLARHAAKFLPSARMLASRFRNPQAQALYGGIAAHGFIPLTQPFSAALGLLLAAAGHRYGWPVAEGGTQSITNALVNVLKSLGVKFETDVKITASSQIPPADITMLSLLPAQVASIYGDKLPEKKRRAYSAYSMGSTAFKVDYLIQDGIPWSDQQCAQAGTVHLGGSFDEMVISEKLRAKGTMSERPFVLLGQQSVADHSRSNGRLHPVTAYAHVPSGFDGDASTLVSNQIERFAPGFKDTIVRMRSTSPGDIEKENAAMLAGDILGGSNEGLQLLFRPHLTPFPYSTGIKGVFICSQATPPGAGVHGMCGYNAAHAALRELRSGN